jgi:hypothetical protein
MAGMVVSCRVTGGVLRFSHAAWTLEWLRSTGPLRSLLELYPTEQRPGQGDARPDEAGGPGWVKLTLPAMASGLQLPENRLPELAAALKLRHRDQVGGQIATQMHYMGFSAHPLISLDGDGAAERL